MIIKKQNIQDKKIKNISLNKFQNIFSARNLPHQMSPMNRYQQSDIIQMARIEVANEQIQSIDLN